MDRTLLIADANPTIQRVVALTFAAEHIRVIGVSNGEQAIARIGTDRPDIVIAEIAGGTRNGYDVAAFVKGQPELAHIPVLLLAGALEPVDEGRATAVRCDGVLVKPFEPQQLVARVRELVGGAAGSPTHVTSGVPRPIDRVVEPRSTSTASPLTPSHAAPVTPLPTPPSTPPFKIVKHPSAAMHADAPSSSTASAAPSDAPRPAASVTASDAPASQHRKDDLDDYFDQLDAAFDHLGAAATRPDPHGFGDSNDDDTARLDVPTLSSVLGKPAPSSMLGKPAPSTVLGKPALPPPPKDEILFGAPPVEPPDIRPVPPHPPREVPPGEIHRSATANAFDALLALDDRERHDRTPVASVEAPAPAPTAVNDELVDAVATRVIARLAPDGLADLVARIVTDVAERLVREEIDRIRGRK